MGDLEKEKIVRIYSYKIDNEIEIPRKPQIIANLPLNKFAFNLSNITL